jgi:RNA polymerase sigma-70 factor (ECF subfamily)
MIELDDKYVEYSVSTITTKLLDRARSGEEEAWSCVVYIYGPLVYKWCRKRGLPRESSRDIAQDVFEVVARKLGEFHRTNVSDTFRGWLRGISDHKIADYWRKQYTSPDPVSVDDPQQALSQIQFREVVDDESPVQDCLDIFERVLQYGKERINPTHWEVFWRVIVDEEDRQDVATLLEMKRTNVDVIVSRVLARLKETFGDAFEDRDSSCPKPRKDPDGTNNKRDT